MSNVHQLSNSRKYKDNLVSKIRLGQLWVWPMLTLITIQTGLIIYLIGRL